MGIHHLDEGQLVGAGVGAHERLALRQDFVAFGLERGIVRERLLVRDGILVLLRGGEEGNQRIVTLVARVRRRGARGVRLRMNKTSRQHD